MRFLTIVFEIWKKRQKLNNRIFDGPVNRKPNFFTN